MANAFNGVQVFSATMYQQRGELSDRVTRWIADHPTFKISDIVVTQSSGQAFHCIAISLFFTDPKAR